MIICFSELPFYIYRKCKCSSAPSAFAFQKGSRLEQTLNSVNLVNMYFFFFLPKACATTHVFVCGKQVKMPRDVEWDFKPETRPHDIVPLAFQSNFQSKWNQLDRPCGGGIKEERTAERQVTQTGAEIGRDNTKPETASQSGISAKQLQTIRSGWSPRGAQVWVSEWCVCGQIQAAMQHGWMR